MLVCVTIFLEAWFHASVCRVISSFQVKQKPAVD